jgi:hypothetical protein
VAQGYLLSAEQAVAGILKQRGEAALSTVLLAERLCTTNGWAVPADPIERR